MASVSIGGHWYDPILYVTLTHGEVQALEKVVDTGGNVKDVIVALGAVLAGAELPPPADLVIAILALVVVIDEGRIKSADHGFGVVLGLPLLALYLGVGTALLLISVDSVNPPPIVYANRIDVFTVDVAGHVWSTGWDATSKKWDPWYEISPGSIPSGGFMAPIAAVSHRQNHLNIFALDKAANIWTAWWDKSPGTWSDWGKLPTPPGTPPNDLFTASIKIQVLGPTSSQLDLFVQRSIAGSGTQLWWTEWKDDVDRWSPWMAVSPAITLTPSSDATGFIAVARDGGHMDVFVNDSFDGGNVWWSEWNAAGAPATWSPWTKIPPTGTSSPSGPLVTAIARDTNHVDVFAGEYLGVSTIPGSCISWSTTTGWGDWIDPSSGTTPQTPLSVAATSPAHLEVIGMGLPPPPLNVSVYGYGVYRNQGNQADPNPPVWSGWLMATDGLPDLAPCAAVAMTPDQVFLVVGPMVQPDGVNSMWAAEYSLSGYGGAGLNEEDNAQGGNPAVIGRIAS